MDKADLRLELLRLTFNHVHGAEEGIAKARQLEGYCLEAVPEPSEAPSTDLDSAKSAARKPGGKKPTDNSIFK